MDIKILSLAVAGTLPPFFRPGPVLDIDRKLRRIIDEAYYNRLLQYDIGGLEIFAVAA